jgi:hypothetical protein
MEKRPRRFSLPETFFEGSPFGGHEDCLSTRRSDRYAIGWSQHPRQVQAYHAEFRSAEKSVEGTALKT